MPVGPDLVLTPNPSLPSAASKAMPESVGEPRTAPGSLPQYTTAPSCAMSSNKVDICIVRSPPDDSVDDGE